MYPLAGEGKPADTRSVKQGSKVVLVGRKGPIRRVVMMHLYTVWMDSIRRRCLPLEQVEIFSPIKRFRVK
jgi:hypothetical protein